MRRSARVHVGLALLVTLVGSASLVDRIHAQPSTDVPPLDRIIGRSYVVAVPVGPCEVPWTVRGIAKVVGLPSGTEHLPGPCTGGVDDGNRANDVPLLGLTVREALQKVAQLDPRFMVLESKGLLLARPVDAWADKNHFLNEPVGEFRVEDMTAAAALGQLVSQVTGRRSYLGDLQTKSAGGGRLLTFDAGATSLNAGLNAIVEAHGDMGWEVEYCAPVREATAAAVRIWFNDGGSVGTGLGPRGGRGASGPSPCIGGQR